MAKKTYSLLLLIVWLVSIVVLGIWGYDDNRHFNEPTPTGARSVCAAGAVAKAEEKATLDTRPDSRTTVVYGRGTGLRHAEVDFQITDPANLLTDAKCLDLAVSSFVRDTNDAELQQGKITAQSSVQGDRSLITVTFDRQGSSFGPGGSYSGFVSVIDPRVQRVDVPITVTLSYPVWQYPLAVTLLMLFPAFVFVVAKLSNESPTLEGSQNYLSTGSGFAALAAGIVAGLGVYTTVYLRSSTWDAEVLQYFSLIAAVVAAFVTVATLPGKAPDEQPAGQAGGQAGGQADDQAGAQAAGQADD